MSYALTRLTGDGSTQTFTIGFAYRDKADIVVKLDGVTQYPTTNYTFVTDSQIRFNTAPANNAAIVIRRATSQNARLVDYVSGAVFKESDLDTDSTQGFFMAQESIDIANDSIGKNNSNLYDAENIRVTNVANPVASTDAATKAYVQSFADSYNSRYYGESATAPTDPAPSAGDLWWDSANNIMKAYNGSGWQNATSAVAASSNRAVFTVGTTSGSYTGSTTTFPTTYDAGFVDVFLNGSKLINGTDFTATNGTTIVLANAASSGDKVDIVAHGAALLTDTNFLPLSGGTVTGVLNVNSTGGLTFDAGALTIASASGASLIREAGSGDLSIEAGNLNLKPNLNETYISCVADGAVTLHYDNAPKLATTNTGISVTGTLSATGYNDSNWNTAYSWGNHASAGYLATSGGTMTGDIDFGANKAKFVGLEIYNTIGNTSVIEETGSGNLNIKGADVRIQTPANEDIIKGEADGAVTLYYNNSPKLATTNTGVSVTGTLSATGYNDSNWNSAYNDKITAVNYSGSTLTLTQQDGGTLTTTINASGGGGSSQWTTSGSNIYYNTGNVGIGTSNPDDVGSSRTLHINDNTHGGAIRLSEGGTNNAFISYDHPTGMRIQSIDTIALKTANTERMRINASGNVGIGTSSPASNLHIYSQAEAKVTIQGDSDNDAGEEAALLEFKTDGNAVAHTIGIKQGTSNDLVIDSGNGSLSTVATGVVFKTKPTGTTTTAERMRIDTSGNLLVGTTDNSPVGNNDSDGIALLANGSGQFSRDGGTALLVNRKTSDGELLRFNKDSAPVGSIGTTGGDMYVGTGDTGIRFDDATNHIRPCGVNGANLDATIDIGDSSRRFKDLYLSGSIHGDTVFENNAGTTEYARFNSSGWLGLGDSSPSAKLHVQSTSTASGCSVTQNTSAFFDAQTNNYIGIGGGITSTLGINFGDSTNEDSGRILYRNSVDTMAFYTLANERMTIDSSGNVGVGTTTPLSRMHLKKYSTASGVAPNSSSALFLDDASSTTLQMGAAYYGTSSILFGKGASGSTSADNDIGSISYSNYYNYLAFRVNAGERMRINSSGSLLVGQTTAGSYGAKVRVGGVTESTYYVSTGSGTRFLNSGYFGSAGINVEAYTDSSTTTVNLVSFKSLSGVQKGSISLVANTVSYNTTSDERLKENIQDAEDAGDKIDAIQVRQFDWKDGGEHQDYGVIAQELDKVAPEAVTKGETEDDIMSVDYSKLVPTLIKEIQSLRNRVAELEKN